MNLFYNIYIFSISIFFIFKILSLFVKMGPGTISKIVIISSLELNSF